MRRKRKRAATYNFDIEKEKGEKEGNKYLQWAGPKIGPIIFEKGSGSSDTFFPEFELSRKN